MRFAAAVVEVEPETKLTDIDDAPKEESRSPATKVDLRKGCKATKLTIVLRNLTIPGFASAYDRYRDRRSIELRAIQSAAEHDAPSSSSNKGGRVRNCKWRRPKGSLGGFLWTDPVKALGSGEFMKVVDYEGSIPPKCSSIAA